MDKRTSKEAKGNISVSSNARSRAKHSTCNVVKGLNFRVRDGNGCFPLPMAADILYNEAKDF